MKVIDYFNEIAKGKKLEVYVKDNKNLSVVLFQCEKIGLKNLLNEEVEVRYKEAEERIYKAIEYINKFENSPEYIDAYDITYWQDEVKKILKGDK